METQYLKVAHCYSESKPKDKKAKKKVTEKLRHKELKMKNFFRLEQARSGRKKRGTSRASPSRLKTKYIG